MHCYADASHRTMRCASIHTVHDRRFGGFSLGDVPAVLFADTQRIFWLKAVSAGLIAIGVSGMH